MSSKAGKERARKQREEHERRKLEQRAAKREVRLAASAAGALAIAGRPAATPASAETFGEAIARLALVEKASSATREVIKRNRWAADEVVKKTLQVISCDSCTAPKGCCKITTLAYLYEAVPIAARLIREARDTPDLRTELESAATEMETKSRNDYFRPCVFLDASERCTVYEDRPSECGSALVVSDPQICSSTDPNARISKLVSPFEMIPPQLEKTFARDVGLPRTDHEYAGALPRMVLLCLQAWNRIDYRDFLVMHGRVAARNYNGVLEGPRSR